MTTPGRRLAKLFPAMTLVAAAAAIFSGETGAGIQMHRAGGQNLFVSRPDRKPGTTLSLRSGTASAATAPGELERLITEVSRHYEMDPGLITTVVGVESGFNHLAVSPKGARGLMQLMPDTAKEYGVNNLHDARENLEGGVAYLRDLARRYNGDMELALAAYNAGPEAVERAAGVPNYRETRDYLRRIETRYGQDLGAGAGPGATGARAPRANGSIHAIRDREGNIVATNLRGTQVRIIRRSTGQARSR